MPGGRSLCKGRAVAGWNLKPFHSLLSSSPVPALLTVLLLPRGGDNLLSPCRQSCGDPALRHNSAHCTSNSTLKAETSPYSTQVPLTPTQSTELSPLYFTPPKNSSRPQPPPACACKPQSQLRAPFLWLHSSSVSLNTHSIITFHCRFMSKLYWSLLDVLCCLNDISAL